MAKPDQPRRTACARRARLSARAALLFLAVSTPNADAEDRPPLAAELEKIRARNDVPALAAAAVREEKIIEIEAVGRRTIGEQVPVTTEDKWHIGSCGKSMTASLAAILVEEGKITWEAKIGHALPELQDAMEPAWQAVSLELLLQHRGGAPTQPADNLWRNAWRATGTPTEQRLEFVRGLLLRRPVARPGEKMIYSNQGYAIAGAMLERAGGQSWETLMRERLFDPLDMKSAGFGAPGEARKIDQPWGHTVADGKVTPVAPGPKADNPAAIGPGGTVHCSIADFAQYAGWHARSVRTTARILGPASFTKLHTAPSGSDYAMGWVVTQRDWAGGKVLTHNGSNTMWYAVMWLAPAKDLAFVAATNTAGKNAERACDEAVSALVGRHAK